jgi:hypothetical protein
MSLIAQKLISASGATEETDPDFNLVTALYHFDTTTDNGNNSTFLDSSSESHTVTPGSTPPTQGSFSPFSAEEGKWGVQFDGSGDYLSVPTSDDFAFGTGDYTIECWFYKKTTGAQFIYEGRDNSDTSARVLFYVNESDKLSTYQNNSAKGSSTDDVPLNSWVHVALTRSSGTGYLFMNGAQVATWSSDTTDLLKPNATLYIGHYQGGGTTYDWDGFISNLRVVKGTAVYTSAFTPSTSPLTAVTNTKLLIGCSNRFRDKSTSAHAITAVNGASIKPFSPFNPSQAYSASVKGGSANFFQLATSKLDVTDASDFDFGTGDFTVEAWVYPTKDLIGGSYPYALMLNGKGNNFYIGWTTHLSAGLVIYGGTGVGSIYSGSTDHVPQKYAWSHIVYQNTSGNFNFYLNGTRVCNVADSGSFPDVTGVTVGVNDAYGNYYMGAHVSDLRVVKGSNVYSNASTLTVPTAPLTSVTNTKLLLNFTNSVFFDSTGKTNARFLSGSGLVRSKTGQKKFGTASAQWTGTGAYLRLNQSLEPDLIPVGGGDFTIEFQLRLTDVTSTQVFIDFRHNSVSNVAPVIYISSGFKFYAGSGEITIGTLSTNTWHHIALVRNGSTITSYIDGTAGGTESNTSNLTTQMLTIGGNYNGDYYLRGYMDELRITIGKARYTANFTAPTEEFLNR